MVEAGLAAKQGCRASECSRDERSDIRGCSVDRLKLAPAYRCAHAGCSLHQPACPASSKETSGTTGLFYVRLHFVLKERIGSAQIGARQFLTTSSPRVPLRALWIHCRASSFSKSPRMSAAISGAARTTPRISLRSSGPRFSCSGSRNRHDKSHDEPCATSLNLPASSTRTPPRRH
jgi:hypothetical protein